MCLKNKKLRTISKLISAEDFVRLSKGQFQIDRSKVKICFLDDEGYTAVDKLSSLGYVNVDVKYEFNSLEDFSEYDVIFCDIQGIGKNIYPKNQGFDIALELHKMFPNTNVFIYTGKDLSLYPELPDGIKSISKQTTMKEIVSILDKECEYLWNPVVAWKKYEIQLREKETPNKFLALLEDRFFSSLIDGENEINENDFNKTINAYNEVKFYVTTLISLVNIILGFNER